MAKTNLSTNQMKTLNTLSSRLPEKLASDLERYLDKNSDSFLVTINNVAKTNHNKYSLTQIKRFATKSFLLNYAKTATDSIIQKSKVLQTRTFNSIPTVNQLLEIEREPIKKRITKLLQSIDNNNDKLKLATTKANNAVMNKFFKDLDKAEKQTKLTLRKKELLSTKKTIINSISKYISLLADATNDKREYNYYSYELADIKNTVLSELAKNPTFTFRLIHEFSDYQDLRKENIDQRPSIIKDLDWRINSFYHLNNSCKEYRDTKKEIEEKQNEYYQNKEKYDKGTQDYQNMTKQGRILLNKVKLLNDSNFMIEANDNNAEIIQCDYCNDYDTPNSTYLNTYIDSKGNESYSFTNNNDSIGKSYSLNFSSNISFNLAFFSTNTKRELVKKLSTDTIKKIKANTKSLTSEIEKLRSSLRYKS